MNINFIDVNSNTAEQPSQEELKAARTKLLEEASHWMKKIAKLNALYSGKINRIHKKLEEIERRIM